MLAHTAELYPMQISGGLSLTAFFPFIYREALPKSGFYNNNYLMYMFIGGVIIVLLLTGLTAALIRCV